MSKIDWSNTKVLTSDCYGTLIDWETGILSALMPILSSRQVHLPSSSVLELYAELEGRLEQGPFMNYKSVLRAVMNGLADRLKITLSEQERDCLVESIKRWQPFPDTVDALRALKSRFKLAIISNTDDDIFSFTRQHLGVKFDWVITAEQVKSYKPSLNNFREALKTIDLPQEEIVHVAQSLYHDITPANQLGLRSVWVDRRRDQQGFGATLPGIATPDVVVPDLRSLVELIGNPQLREG